MPSAMPASATIAPMLPRPATPRVLPSSSGPAKCFLSFSIRAAIFLCSSSSGTILVFVCWMPSMMPRDARSMPQMTSSLTELALAPGVLNTGMPSSVIFATLQLLVPAPQRAMARHSSGTSASCSLWLRSRMACVVSAPSSSTTYLGEARGELGGEFVSLEE